MTNSKMLGKTTAGGACRCCPDDLRKPARRTAKRRERQGWKKNLSDM